MSGGIALLCGAGDSSAAVANALVQQFGPIPIFVERKERPKVVLKRRIRRLGLVTVLGQVAFLALAVPPLRRVSRGRIAEIVAVNGIDLGREVFESAMHVESVNGPEVTEWLVRERPRVVIVNGTRIIARRVLEATDAIFINTHCGITPEYRGSHGAYWALSLAERELCGATVHLVDAGIDTGGILAQCRIDPGPADNFVTYPYLQLAAALPLLINAVNAASGGRLEPKKREARSGLWYHPTLWAYLALGLRRSIW